jgi:hypothetical protein
MTAKPTALASLDIVSEGLAQQDGLAERLTRQRSSKSGGIVPVVKQDSAPSPTSEQGRKEDSIFSKNDHNAWRRGKALLQVAIPNDIHIELGVLAKRRQIQLSHIVRAAINLWLEKHSYTLRIPDGDVPS